MCVPSTPPTAVAEASETKALEFTHISRSEKEGVFIEQSIYAGQQHRDTCYILLLLDAENNVHSSV
jgi:hypothetical protein